MIRLSRLPSGILLLKAKSEAPLCPIQCFPEGLTFSSNFELKSCLDPKFETTSNLKPGYPSQNFCPPLSCHISGLFLPAPKGIAHPM